MTGSKRRLEPEMNVNWKRVGYLLGIVLALGPVYGLAATLIAMAMSPGAEVLAPQQAQGAMPPAVMYSAMLRAFGTAILLPVGAILIILSLSSMLKEKRSPELDPSELRTCRSLAQRRTVAWGIDAIGVPVAVGLLFHAFSGGQTGTSAGFLNAFILLYILFKDAGTGRSLGKMITGIKVVGSDGVPPGLMTTFKRNLPLLLPVIPWIAGAHVWAYRGQRIGEGWAGTHVEPA